jgi:23S rRNA pseudouridine2605 synthase
MTPPDKGSERLHKVLARTGIASRREAEEWIRAGRVSVDGKPAVTGQSVGPRSRIAVDGKPVRVEAQKHGKVLIYHKPAGRICSRSDPAGRPTVFEDLPRIRGARWIGVGRLDFNTTGLLLFTTDGELANRLTHPSRGVDREYLCRVQGDVSAEFLRRLREGIDLDGKPARFESVSPEGGSGTNRWYRVVVREGRYREVRRMWASGGYRVSRLIRVRYGPIQLPRDLKPGNYRNLDSNELRALYQSSTRDSRTPSRKVHAGPRKSAESRPARKT